MDNKPSVPTIAEAVGKAVSLADQRKAEYIFMEAQKQKLADNFDAFYDLLSYAHELDPGNTAISYYMGMCLLKMNNTTKERCEQALELLKGHFEAQPEDLYETTFYSDANMQLGHPEEALRAIKVLNEHNPNRLELQVRLAEAYSRSGDFVQSNITLDSIATLFGKSIQITSNKIENYMAMNDSVGALREMRSMLATAPQNDSYNLAMSGLFQHYGMTDSALYYLDRAQEYAPDNGLIYLTRAEYCNQAGDSAGYEQQISLKRTLPSASTNCSPSSSSNIPTRPKSTSSTASTCMPARTTRAPSSSWATVWT